MFAQDTRQRAGKLLLSLCYLLVVERLDVTVIKALNLKPMDISGTSGGYSADTFRISDTHTRTRRFFYLSLRIRYVLVPLVPCADPYVKLELILRGRHLKKRKTEMRKRTLNPVFNESHIFDAQR